MRTRTLPATQAEHFDEEDATYVWSESGTTSYVYQRASKRWSCYNSVKSSPFWQPVVISFLLLVIVGIFACIIVAHNRFAPVTSVVYVDTSPSPTTDALSMIPSSSPTVITNENVLQAVHELMGVVPDPGTPQFQAVGWMSTFDVGTDPRDPHFPQRYALVVFYFALNGDDWHDRQDWLSPDLHECDWSTDIICKVDPTGGRNVVGLDDVRNNLKGQLPPELRLLPKLEYIILESNQLTGTLPLELFESRRLTNINLARNNLIGLIPQIIGRDDRLLDLDLHQNHLSGAIPAQLYELPLITTLDLSSNKLTGTLSSLVATMDSMKKFDISNNLLAGTLPPKFNQNLDIVHLDSNRFSGPVGDLVNTSMVEFTVSHNELTGALPTMLSTNIFSNTIALNDYRLQTIDLSFNKFQGKIPSPMGLLSSLRIIDISGNDLTGRIPNGENFWLNLEYFGASDNQLKGTIPFSISRKLRFLDLSDNDLTGGIPDDFEQHPNLEIVILHDNINLGGKIPGFTPVSGDRLRDIDLDSCGLVGSIPRSMSTLTKLEIFRASNNFMTGPIPSTLSSLSVLKTFTISENDVTGTVPNFFGDFVLLKDFEVDNNELSGNIPDSLGELSTLETFTVHGNDGLGGTIPDGVCRSIQTNTGDQLNSEFVGCLIECTCCAAVSQVDLCGPRKDP